MSDMKCPFCQQELDTGNYFVHCHNPHCDITEEMEGTEEMWEALIRTRKALDVAVDAIKNATEYLGNQEPLVDVMAMNLHTDLSKALEQIKTITETRE